MQEVSFEINTPESMRFEGGRQTYMYFSLSISILVWPPVVGSEMLNYTKRISKQRKRVECQWHTFIEDAVPDIF